MLFLGLMFITSGTIVCIVVAVIASGAGDWVRARAEDNGLLKWISGLVFIGLGLRLAFLERK